MANERTAPFPINQRDHEPGAHIMMRLTYISRYNPQNPPIELARILEQAQNNNKACAITGVLIINEDFFIQSIEGTRPAINRLLRALVNDKRHFSLQIIDCLEVVERRWQKWSMKYLTLSEQNKDEVFKLTAGTSFNPYLMNKAQLLMMIDALSKRQEQQEQGYVAT